MKKVAEIREEYNEDFELIRGYAEHFQEEFDLDKLNKESMKNYDSIMKSAIQNLNEKYTGVPLDSKEFNHLKVLNIVYGINNPNLGITSLDTKLPQLGFSGREENAIVNTILNKTNYDANKDKITLGDILDLKKQELLRTRNVSHGITTSIDNRLKLLGHGPLN